MRIRWREFELPSNVVLDTESGTALYGKFIVEPFERGFGTTIGNSIRRVLLASIEGAAVTSVKIDGVLHEFSTINGIAEDVTDIILNVKQILLNVNSNEEEHITLSSSKKGPLAASMIECGEHVEIVNGDLVICNLTENVDFHLEMTTRRGRGYVTAQENEILGGGSEVGLIYVDSIFTPVRRVRFNTEDTRVGKLTNYDKLILEIWTDKTITPEMALVEASKILRKHLNPFVQYFDIGREMPLDEIKEDESKRQEKYWKDLQARLDQPITVLDLSVRATNCLESENIQVIRDLVSNTESEMLKVRNFGKTSLREIKKKLGEINLSLGISPELLGKEEPASAT